MTMEVFEQDGSIEVVSDNALSTLTRAEVDIQISTAKRYTRSVTTAVADAKAMATCDPQTAASCFYVLPARSDSGKAIEGPSVRLAEIFASCWGNLRFGSRIIGMDDKFVIAQGVAHDLEKNIAVSVEVRRRITKKNGQRFGDDMIGVTQQAAMSIAFRNAIYKVLPRTFVNQVYDQCRAVVRGDAQTSTQRLKELVGKIIAEFKITADRIPGAVGKKFVQDFTIDDIVALNGICTAIREGNTTIDDAFPRPGVNRDEPEPSTLSKADQAAEKIAAARAAKAKPTEPAKPEPEVTIEDQAASEIVPPVTPAEIAPEADDLSDYTKFVAACRVATEDWTIDGGFDSFIEKIGLNYPVKSQKPADRKIRHTVLAALREGRVDANGKIRDGELQ